MKISAVCLALLLAGAAVAQEPLPVSTNPDEATPALPQGQSLADIARKLRKDHTTEEVKVTVEETKKILGSVEELLKFASEDTGFPKRTAVKSRMVGADEVEKSTREHLAKAEYAQRFARAEWTMKKFGLVPKSFSLKEFVVKANAKSIAGYYDNETKTISLLNWIPFEKQAPVLAHELTHALQDQNYDLMKWAHVRQNSATSGTKEDNDDATFARHAVVEGQAMVVLYDYLLARIGRNLKNTPGLIYSMEDESVKATIDSQLLHDAPMILREEGAFPYRYGLIFEVELLQAGGKEMAFAGAFARPPRTSHEVFQPRAYIEQEKTPALHMPDLRQAVSEKYAVYDQGSFGEIDVRALLKQLNNRKVADTLASEWQGGSYVTFRKLPATGDPTSTSDLALFYVSKWKTPKSAEQFAKLYAASVGQRYQQVTEQPVAACSGEQCPLLSVRNLTEEGPSSVEQWADNTVIISESFDDATAAKLRDTWRTAPADVHAQVQDYQELGSRLFDMPGYAAFQEEIGRRIAQELADRMLQ